MLEYITVWDDENTTDDWQIIGANRSNTDHGRLYIDVSIAAGDVTLILYKDADLLLAVASGTLAGEITGTLNLIEQNSSGLTGAVRLTGAKPLADSFLDVFYADDDDVTARHPAVNDLLIDGKFNGQQGFTEPLARAKRTIDSILESCCTEDTEPLINLQQLADVCALYALYFIFDAFATDGNSAASQLAARFRWQARHTFFEIKVQTSSGVYSPLNAFVVRS
ncbi:MAG: hypothetical protein L3J82_06145 [Planctomycetes bacterium]|nr:hypothetical protein [Planctomycetota bacterium]